MGTESPEKRVQREHFEVKRETPYFFGYTPIKAWQAIAWYSRVKSIK